VLSPAWRSPQPSVALNNLPHRHSARDGSICVTHTDTSRLVTFCADLTPSATPLHALAASPSGGRCAAAWLDRFVVIPAPWRGGTRSGCGNSDNGGATLEYRCPEVSHHQALTARKPGRYLMFADLGLLAGIFITKYNSAHSQLTPTTFTPSLLQVPPTLPPGVESRLAFLPSATHLLLFTSPCLGAAALLFDAAAGAPLRSFALPAPPAALAACPSGGLLAFGLADGGLLLADALGESFALLTGQAGAVAALAFAGCGRSQRLLSVSGEVLWAWHAHTLQRRQ
jgi:hypothetical protein